MARFTQLLPDHVAPDVNLADYLTPAEIAQVEGRCNVVRKLKALPIEAVVRGYLIGSGWKDYQKTGAVCGITLPAGLQMADKLPEPIRSEEHTSELQSLMRISYAVFCLKNKKNISLDTLI